MSTWEGSGQWGSRHNSNDRVPPSKKGSTPSPQLQNLCGLQGVSDGPSSGDGGKGSRGRHKTPRSDDYTMGL